MFFRILKNELKRKRTMNMILFLFITMATMFLGSSVSNLLTINGAVDYFLGISDVPDYFAISLVDGEKDVIADYVSEFDEVTDYEVIDTFNITNERISIVETGTTTKKEAGKRTGEETENARKDADENTAKKYERTTTLCVQAVSDGFMKAYDQEGKTLQLREGEIAFPRLEAENNDLQVGDKVAIKVGEVTKEFTIAVITKDAVFGSGMMGFKRLLICDEDFREFETQENLIYTKIYNVNFDDRDAFFDGWQKQNFNLLGSVEKETISISYVFDMLIAGVLIIVSVCLILIAFMVLRFTIVFTIQEDFREIGIMKAIGLRDAGIKGVYLVKYFALAVLGAIAGTILSFPFGRLLLKQSITNLVVNQVGDNVILRIFCAVFVVGVVILFSNLSANSLKKFTAIDAIRNGSNGERYQAKGRVRLWKRKSMKPGLFMALNDILSNPKRFAVLTITFCIGTMLILLPLGALHTLTGEKIVTMFGLPVSDVYLDNGKADDYVGAKDIDVLQKDLEEMENELSTHGIEAELGAQTGYVIPCFTDDPEDIYTYFTEQEVGNMEGEYTVLEGRVPKAEDEIMLTELTAKELNVAIGDTISFQYTDEVQKFIITGVYQSMMNMGKGFKVSRKAQLEEGYLSGVVCLQAEVLNLDSEQACERIKEVFPDIKVMNSVEFISNLNGGIADMLEMMIGLLTVVVLVINSMITVLMMKAMMTKERGDIALLKSLGFSEGSIRGWQIQRILLILVIAIGMGNILSKVLAPFTIEPIFKMMGASEVQLEVKPLEAYVLYPLLLLGVTGISALLCTGEVKKVEAREVNHIE